MNCSTSTVWVIEKAVLADTCVVHTSVGQLDCNARFHFQAMRINVQTDLCNLSHCKCGPNEARHTYRDECRTEWSAADNIDDGVTGGNAAASSTAVSTAVATTVASALAKALATASSTSPAPVG